MAKPLIIVESPAKARTIGKMLGNRYLVKASMGHVRDLPRSQFGVDIQKGFEPKYINIRGKGDIIRELKETTRKADRVYLATDPDREGEAISWHLMDILGLNGDEPCRIVFHEITRDAVQRALKEPREIDRRLVDAQQARRILDRLVGYRLSPLLWRKVRKGLSAGRVQSVAVRLICDREAEIESFVQEEYWSLTARLSREDETDEENIFEASYQGRDGKKAELKREEDVQAVVTDVTGREFVVRSVRRRKRNRYPAPPFTTSTLQQEASRKLGFTARRTMAVAQQLYEGLEVGAEGSVGLVTYIRTDSTRLSETAVAEARKYIAERYGREYAQPGRRAKAAPKGAQDAHEAIRPTSVRREPEAVKPFLTRDQFRLYRLIWDRFVASQMSPAVLDTLTVDIAAGPHLFRASGSTLKFPGFMTIYIEGRDEEEMAQEGMIPEVAEGEKLRLRDLVSRQHFTQPPPRYTEAMLVKTLEEKGIGRPSTYAPTIETIQQRGYVVKEEKRFVPTELGKVVVGLLKEHFPRIIDVEFTADMESQLDKVEEGFVSWRELLAGFYRPFEQDLEAAEEAIERVELTPEETDVECEECGRRMVIKHGRYGRFLACPRFPECRYTRPLLEETGARCPECGGDIVVRRSKRGRRFYGCSRYPECRFVAWKRPAGKDCPVCGAFLVEDRARGRGQRLVCSRETCGYVEATGARK